MNHFKRLDKKLCNSSKAFSDPPQADQALTRVNSTNIQYEGLRIGGVGRRMNSKVNKSNKVCIESKHDYELGLLFIYPSPSSPGPYI
jgi:hypothetical protein